MTGDLNHGARMQQARANLAVHPGDQARHNDLGVWIAQLGTDWGLQMGLRYFRRAHAIGPGQSEIVRNMLQAVQVAGSWTDLERMSGAKIVPAANFAEAWRRRSELEKQNGRLSAAALALRRAIVFEPASSDAWLNLGSANFDMAEHATAVVCTHRSMAVNPSLADGYSNLLFILHHAAGTTRTQLRQVLSRWQGIAESLPATPRRPCRTSSPIRVGFVSPDLCRHPVGQFLLPLLQARKRSHWSAHLFAVGSERDAMTEELATASDSIEFGHGIDDQTLARIVGDRSIDILIDLAGHTAGNRLQLFRRRPAAVQATWLGYFDTTGLAEIDYILSDPTCIPREEFGWYTERVLWLGTSFVGFAPPRNAPAVSSGPALANGYVTFGCFNQFAKITHAVVRLWCRVLEETPRSRLILRARALDDGAVRARTRSLFARNGIGEDRIELGGAVGYRRYLEEYSRIDVALDPFPRSGSTVTCEALWMGVPVLTLKGGHFAGRHTSSHLYAVGLSQWVASDECHYLALAKRAAANTEELGSLRQELRRLVANSPLVDVGAFAEEFGRTIEVMTGRSISEGASETAI